MGSEYIQLDLQYFCQTVPLLPLLASNISAFSSTLQRTGMKGFGQQTHISPRNFRIDVRWHISTAVLLLQLSFTGDQPVLQHVRLLLELLRKRQSLFQVLLPLRYLKEKENEAIFNILRDLQASNVASTDLSPQVIIKQFEGCELFIHGFGVLRLLFLYNLSACLYHRLHLELNLT